MSWKCPKMGVLLRVIVFLCCFSLAVFTDPPCVMELECEECVPENMPVVTSHRADNGSVRVAAGDEVLLACHGGKFLQYPMHEVVAARCEAGRYRVRQDAALRSLLDLGCQENVFEDVQHHVEWCGAPLEGRAYQTRLGGAGGWRHLATLCWDGDAAAPVRARAAAAPHDALALAPHRHRAAPLSLLGNFNHMFDLKTRADAHKLYGDELRMNRRLHEILKHEKHTFADQTLTAAKLLSGLYFEDQNARVTDFVSNKLAVWRSVASGNLRLLHEDVARVMARTRPRAVVDVYAGTHGVMSVRSGQARSELYLKPGKRFPVPKYIWTVVHDRSASQAAAIVVVNDPFVAVSEIRDTLFCESSCSKLPWLHHLKRNRNYETPLYGLVFCCNIHEFTNIVNEMPKDVFINVPMSADGLLTQSYS